MIELEGKIENPILTFGDFRSPFSKMYRTVRQKVCKIKGSLALLTNLT